MNWIRYSIGNTRAFNTMPLSIGAPQVHASGVVTAVAAADQAQTSLGYLSGIFRRKRVFGRTLG